MSSFTFPLSAAVFRANRLVSGSTKMVFLCFLYQIEITPLRLVTFLGIMLLLSFSSAGIPGGIGVSRMLPAYLAIGVPVEAVLLVETVESIPDIFKTLVNVTAYTAVAAILIEWLRGPQAAAETATEAAGG